MLEPGQVLCDRYQLSQLLGQAPGRQTWLATDQTAATPEPVVVKLLAFADTMQWVDLKLFEREAQVLQQLRHAYMPRYRDSFTLEDRLHWFGLVQDYIPGKSLKQCLDQGQHFSERQILDIATNILHLLTYLHGLSPPVLHRDIKPSNLILGEDGYVYLIDFGAVQDRAAVEGASFTVVGSYGYTPMEQFGGRAVPASDLYALGATLIRLLTGVAPADLPQDELHIEFADRVSVSPGLVRWIQQLTEPSIKKRFQTAQAALVDLRSAPHAMPLTSPRPRPAVPNLLAQHSAAALIAERPPYRAIKVREVGNQLVLQVPGTNSTTEIVILAVSLQLILFLLWTLILLWVFLGATNWSSMFSLASVVLTPGWFAVSSLLSGVTALGFLHWVTKPITFQLNSETFVLSKTSFGGKALVGKGKLQDIEDVYYITPNVVRWINKSGRSLMLRRVVLQTYTKQVYLGGSLQYEEARWLVDLLRAWLAEHR